MLENDAVAYLMALKRVNEALLEGLKACVFVLENEKQMAKERRLSMIESLKGLIAQAEKAYENVPTQQ